MISPLIGDLMAFHFTAFAPGACGVPEHLHPFHQLDVILEGDVEIDVEGQGNVALCAGEALLLPPLWKHRLFFSRKGFRQGSYKFYMGASYFAFFPARPVRLALPGEIVAAVEASGREEGVLAPAAIVAAGTLALLRFAAPAPAAGDAPPDRFRRRLFEVIEQVSRAPFHPWTVGELARRAGVADGTFTRRFLRLLKKSPRQFLAETRIREAARLLAADAAAEIKQVAEAAGYRDVHSFTKAFTRVTGTTPGKIRRVGSCDQNRPVRDKDSAPPRVAS